MLCYHINTVASLDPRGFVKCSSLIQSLFDTLVLTWNKWRSAPASLYINELAALEVIIQSISQVNKASLIDE